MNGVIGHSLRLSIGSQHDVLALHYIRESCNAIIIGTYMRVLFITGLLTDSSPEVTMEEVES